MTDQKTETWEPVNIAEPKWACPHCNTKYGTNHADAADCAAAGPAPDVEAGDWVLHLLNHETIAVHRSPAGGFGKTEVGPVRVTRVDGKRTHVRDVSVNGESVSAAKVAAAGKSGPIRVMTSNLEGKPPEFEGHLRSSGMAMKVYHHLGVTDHVWSNDYSFNSSWVRTMDAKERAMFDMLNPGVRVRMIEADEDAFKEKLKKSFLRQASYGSGMRGLFTEDAIGYRLADAHGSPCRQWSLRWLTAHLDAIISWHTKNAIAWAKGEDADVLLPTASLGSGWQDLPNNPGKKRTALMDEFEVPDYRTAASKLETLLRVAAPTNPIPDVPTVVETVTGKKGI